MLIVPPGASALDARVLLIKGLAAERRSGSEYIRDAFEQWSIRPGLEVKMRRVTIEAKSTNLFRKPS
jgi:hypothetical protein